MEWKMLRNSWKSICFWLEIQAWRWLSCNYLTLNSTLIDTSLDLEETWNEIKIFRYFSVFPVTMGISCLLEVPVDLTISELNVSTMLNENLVSWISNDSQNVTCTCKSINWWPLGLRKIPLTIVNTKNKSLITKFQSQNSKWPLAWLAHIMIIFTKFIKYHSFNSYKQSQHELFTEGLTDKQSMDISSLLVDRWLKMDGNICLIVIKSRETITT